ncbi:hypothetical protein [Phormidium nigroviride]
MLINIRAINLVMKEEGRRKKEEGRRKKEEGRGERGSGGAGEQGSRGNPFPN